MSLSVNSGAQTGNISSGSSISPAAGISANAGDICHLHLFINGGTSHIIGDSVSGGGLTWAKRSSTLSIDTYGNDTVVELWWAYTSGAQSDMSPTATLSGNVSPGNATCAAFSVTGFTGSSYSTNPWDTATWNSAYTAANTTATGSIPSLTGFATSNVDTMVIGALFEDSGTTQTAGAGFSLVANYNGSPSGAVEEQVFSSAQSDLTISFGTLVAPWLLVGDALSQTGSGGSTPTDDIAPRSGAPIILSPGMIVPAGLGWLIKRRDRLGWRRGKSGLWTK